MTRMNRTLCLLSLSLLVLALSSGCATIVGGGGSQEVTFNSQPDGATVTVSGRTMGKTPMTVRMDRKTDQVLKFEKEGYKTIEMQLTTDMNPWFWGNIILGGLVGSTTDGVTGSMHQYSPNQYLVNLVPVGQIAAIGIDTRKSSIKSYIVTNYNSISAELSAGQGEYLRALYALLEIPEPDHKVAYEKMRSISDGTKDIIKFADNVVSAYMQ
jgi:hypothetical protein